MSSIEKQALLSLSYIKGMGVKSLQSLLSKFSSAAEIWHLSNKQKNAIQGMRSDVIQQIGDKAIWQTAENEIRYCAEHEINILTYDDPNYPYLLKECGDGPMVVFSRGNIDLNQGKFISIVGTRKMTSRGKDFIHELVSGFKNQKITIVSGLALGVDAEAHKAAIENELPTVGVLAHGVNQIYPKTNERIGRKMMSNGGLFSEFSTFHVPEPENFLRRNRIIAALCQATVIIESGIAGGAMSTARHANNYNRDVFAVPGRVTDISAAGCHHLIKNHQAFLLTEAKDVLKYLNLTPKKTRKTIQKELFISLTEIEQRLYDTLQKNGKLHIDHLAMEMNLTTYQMMPVLLDLELKSLIEPLPGKYYDLC